MAGLEQVSVPTNGPVPITTSYVFDPLGHVASRLDTNGRLIDQSFYDGFGKLIGDWQNGTGLFVGGQDVVGWGGQWGAYTDIENWNAGQPGLLLLTHRYYNPDTGRFLTRDPIGYDGGINIYAYCRNNPIMSNDPLGLSGVGDWIATWFKGTGKAAWDSFIDQAPFMDPVRFIFGNNALKFGTPYGSDFGVYTDWMDILPMMQVDCGMGGMQFEFGQSKGLIGAIESSEAEPRTSTPARITGKKPKDVQFERYGSKAEAEASEQAGRLLSRPGHEGQPKWIGEPGTVDPRTLGKRENYTHKMTITAHPDVMKWLDTERNIKEGESTKVKFKDNEPRRYGIKALEEFNAFVKSVKASKR